MNNVAEHLGTGKCKDPQHEAKTNFVVGDVVVYSEGENISLNEIYKVHSSTCVSVKPFQGSLLAQRFASIDLLRHATVAEIQAKRRLPQVDDMGDDAHIENHISRSCRVVSNDESVHLGRALKALGEVS